MSVNPVYRGHLHSGADLVTTYEATRAGFIALALERNRRATPYVEEARALQTAALTARQPADLLTIDGIEAGLLAAAGLSDKALKHLRPEDKRETINGLIKNFLDPAGSQFVEELVFRFLLTKGDALGGSMRNIGGILAQRKVSRAILANLTIAGIDYRWQDAKTSLWTPMSDDDVGIEMALRGLSWRNHQGERTLIYNLRAPLVRTNADLCLLSASPEQLNAATYQNPELYLAFGELKGGIDPAGADEHWKTASAAIERIRVAFAEAGYTPALFFVGAAVQQRMATEIWDQLERGLLSNAANLNEAHQIAALSRWLCSL